MSDNCRCQRGKWQCLHTLIGLAVSAPEAPEASHTPTAEWWLHCGRPEAVLSLQPTNPVRACIAHLRPREDQAAQAARLKGCRG